MACKLQAKKIDKAIKILEETRKEVEKTPVADSIKDELASSIENTLEMLSFIVEEVRPSRNVEDIIESWLTDMEWDYSLWECIYERPKGLGDKTFHGNCSPTLIAALLKKYSTLDDGLIFDPMVGSGTFIDVASSS